MGKQVEVGLEVRSYEEDDEYFILRGIANTPSVDSYDTIIEPKGAEFELPIPFFLIHDISKPVGEVFEAGVTDSRIEFAARIPKKSISQNLQERLNEAIDSVRLGLMKGVSVGIEPVKQALRKGKVVYTNWKWKELSLVPIPANKDARVTSFRADRASKRGEVKMDIREQLTALEEERAAIAAEMESYGNPADLEGEDAKAFDELTKRFDEVRTKRDRASKLVDAMDSARPVTTREHSYAPNVTPRQSAEPRIEAKRRDEPKGMTFARYVRAQIISAETRAPINQVINHLYGFGDVAAEVRASTPVDAGSTLSGNWGTKLFQPNAAAVEFLEYLAPFTLVGKFGRDGVSALGRGRFFVPMVSQTSVGQGYWVGQGVAKPATSQTFADDSIVRYKLAAIVGATDELLDLANATDAENQILISLRQAVIETLDGTFIDASNKVDNGRPAGLLYSVSGTTGSGGSTGTDVSRDVAALRKALKALNYPGSGMALIISSSLAIDLVAMRSPLTEAPLFPTLRPDGGTLEGIPVLVTDYIDPTKVVMMHAPSVYFADGGVSTAVSNSATVILNADAETLASGTPNFSAFQRDAQIFRIVRYVGWTKRTGAVQVMADVAWGGSTETT